MEATALWRALGGWAATSLGATSIRKGTMTELNPAGISAEQLNQTIAYTQYVYTRHGGAGADAADPQTQLDRWVEKWTGRGVTVRGLYDASGFKADSTSSCGPTAWTWPPCRRPMSPSVVCPRPVR